MKPALKIAFLFAAIWMAVKFAFFKFDFLQDDIQISGLINNFLLLTAISVGLYLEKKKEGAGKGTPLSDIKNALTAGAPYVLLVSAFMYFYYNSINPSFIENKVTERMDQIYIDMERPSFVDSLKVHNPEINEWTNEEIVRKMKEDTENNLAPFSMFIFSLLGLLIMALTYAILVTLIYRKILFRTTSPPENT